MSTSVRLSLTNNYVHLVQCCTIYLLGIMYLTNRLAADPDPGNFENMMLMVLEFVENEKNCCHFRGMFSNLVAGFYHVYYWVLINYAIGVDICCGECCNNNNHIAIVRGMEGRVRSL